MLCLLLAVFALLFGLIVLGMLVLSLHREKESLTTGRIILNGGKSVNTEVIRENMGKGILNEHAGEFLATVVSGRNIVGRKHWILLTDCADGQKYRAYFHTDLMIGSMEESDGKKLVISKSGISRSHCRVYLYEGFYAVQDWHSTNHTWLNGFLLEKPCFLHDGDCLQLGQRKFQVKIGMEKGLQ